MKVLVSCPDLLIYNISSRRGVEEKEGLVLCHYCHQEWKELKDSTPLEPFRRGKAKNLISVLSESFSTDAER